MTDFEFDNPAFDRDDVDEDADDETSFINPNDATGEVAGIADGSGAGTRVRSLQQRLLQTAVDNYYEALVAKGLTSSLGRDITKFELDASGRLRLKAFPDVRLVALNKGEPLAFSTIADRRNGGAVIKALGFEDWKRSKRKMSAAEVSELQKASKGLGKAAASAEHVPLQDLGQIANEASNTVHTLETALSDANIDDPPLTRREIRGLYKALQTYRGELTNNLAQISELDKHIATEERKLATEGIDESIKRRITERIRELKEERGLRLEAASANREALRSQINRMHETIDRILHTDTTLAERIRTLFREQGITIASILTAIGMVISTLVLALTGSGGSIPTPPQPPSKGRIKEWIKKHLQSLGRALARLAGKAAAALPGIIGSIVSWLLTLLGKTAGWLAENLWAVVVAVGGLLLVVAREWLLPKKPKH